MQATNEVIIAAIIIIAAYDIYRAASAGYKATISYAILTDSRAYPIIAFAAGVLAGHFFWSQP